MNKEQMMTEALFQLRNEAVLVLRGCDLCGYNSSAAALVFENLNTGETVEPATLEELAQTRVICANCAAIQSATLSR